MDVVNIDKVFGPTIMSELKIEANTDDIMWNIFRLDIKTNKFIFWCAIPGQMESDFDE